MIVGGNSRTRRGSFLQSWKNEKRQEQAAAGTRVIVLRAGRYNGPRNKTLGLCDAGDLISVASGPYAQSLIADGFVSPYDASLEDRVETFTKPATATVTVVADVVPAEKSGDGQPDPKTGEKAAEPESDPEPSVDPDGWRVFLGAGVSETIAHKLFDAGLTGHQAVRDLINDAGAEALLSLQGVGQSTVDKLVTWAQNG